MILLPRVAVGTVQPGTNHHVITSALMQALVDHGLRVQAFFAQGCFAAPDAAHAITGLRRRYLDSWLMERDVCLELLTAGSQYADLALVEGVFDVARYDDHAGGSLDCLADCLSLPRLAIVDAARMPLGAIPDFPRDIAGIMLDNVRDTAHHCHLQTTLESLLGIPVLGSLEQLRCLRVLFTDSFARGMPTRELCVALGRELRRRLQLDQLLELVSSRPLPSACQRSYGAERYRQSLHVAVALDEAFTCYFPDTLDVLEQHGATVSVFSPLSGDQLPAGCDVLYFGCGRPECFAEHLAGNICMKEAVWNHVASGGRIYAESAGIAYLSREMELPDGTRWPMVGVIPSRACLDTNAGMPEATTVTVGSDCWLFAAGQPARGYLNRRWCLCDNCELPTLAVGSEHRRDLVGSYQVVASRLHQHFAAQPTLIRHFFQPARRAPANAVV